MAAISTYDYKILNQIHSTVLLRLIANFLFVFLSNYQPNAN